MDSKYYQPDDKVLEDFAALLQQQRIIYLNRFESLKGRQHLDKLNMLYDQALTRVQLEKNRKSSKYSISVRELIELQTKDRGRPANYFEEQKLQENLYPLLTFRKSRNGAPLRNEKGYILVDKQRLLKHEANPDLALKIQNRLNAIKNKIEESGVVFPDRVMKDCFDILNQERHIYKAHFHDQPEILELLDAWYKETFQYMDSRKSALPVDQAGKHNEILAANTKSAVRALYAPKDTLFDRLNLALHAKNIKEQFHYDVPLLVMSQDKPPYFYSEQLLKADLERAYDSLKRKNFPYDRTMLPAYEKDAKGKPVLDKKGRAIRKKLLEPKNLEYQQQTLVDIFKIGADELENLNQLAPQSPDDQRKLDDRLDDIINKIVSKIDLIGNPRREARLVERAASDAELEKLLLRESSLGHAILVEKIKNKISEYKSETFEHCKTRLEFLATCVWKEDDALRKYVISTSNFLINNQDILTVSEMGNINRGIEEKIKLMQSPEMTFVRQAVDKLEKNAHSMFGIGNRKKANAIKSAVVSVPLEKRDNVFQDKEVKKALAQHRIRSTRAVDEKGEVVDNKAASSFKNIKNKLQKIQDNDKTRDFQENKQPDKKMR